MKRISAALGIAVIVLFVSIVIARTRRAQADAAFITIWEFFRMHGR